MEECGTNPFTALPLEFQILVVLLVIGFGSFVSALLPMVGLGWIFFSIDGYQICEENRVDGYEISYAWSAPLAMNELNCWYVTEGDECLTEFRKTKEFGVVVVYQSCRELAGD